MTVSAETAVLVDNIRFAFPLRPGVTGERLFDNFSVRVSSYSTLVIMGSSGIGKSTLAELMAGQLVPQSGAIHYSSEIRRTSDVSYIDQHPMNGVYPWQTAYENIDYPLRKLNWPQPERKDRVARLTELFRLGSVSSSYPARLSGGELQRLALARNLSWRPKLAILDESFAALDIATRTIGLEALKTLAQEDGMTLIAVTHNISDAIAIGDRCIILAGRPAGIVGDLDMRERSFCEGNVQQLLLAAIRNGHL